jgi:tungstate transport system ATP-binding protein
VSAPPLELHGIVVRRRERLVLDLEHLTVAPGEILAVMGPNGAGKSTLLEVAALLRRPDHGEVAIGGVLAERRTERALRRGIAMVFQSPLLFDRPVLDNVAAGPRFRGVGRAKAELRALGWLERFGVAHLAGRGARSISGGEAQRVALARAFAVEPALLLLDEPFAALDAPTRVALVPDLARALRDSGTAAVLVTHDRTDAQLLADRVAVIEAGRLIQIGAVAEVTAAPATPLVTALLRPEMLVAEPRRDIG